MLTKHDGRRRRVGQYLEVWDSMDFRVTTHFLRKLHTYLTLCTFVHAKTMKEEEEECSAMILPPPDIDQGETYYLSIERL